MQEAMNSREAPPPPPPMQFSGSNGANAESLFSALIANDDADGDGMISQSELSDSPVGDMFSDQFSTIDTDGDGLLSEAEFNAAEETGRGPHGPGGPPPGPPPTDSTGSTDDLTTALQALLDAMDTDGDGSVSSSEIQDFASRLNSNSESDTAVASSIDTGTAPSVANDTAANGLLLVQNFLDALAKVA